SDDVDQTADAEQEQPMNTCLDEAQSQRLRYMYCHWGGVATTVELPKARAEKQRSLAPQAFPGTSRGGERTGGIGEGEMETLTAMPPSAVVSLPLVSVDLWRAWNQCSRLALDHDA
ncbi:unnamed protein product, partial [Aureobasidium pullulans]